MLYVIVHRLCQCSNGSARLPSYKASLVCMSGFAKEQN